MRFFIKVITPYSKHILQYLITEFIILNHTSCDMNLTSFNIKTIYIVDVEYNTAFTE